MHNEREYDVVVIGAGSTGENVADRVVKGGLSAVIIEAELVGGDCSYWACMPSKALLRPSHALDAARRVAGAREAVSGVLDASFVLERRDRFASNWDDDGQVKWLDGAGIDLVRGHGRLAGEREVEVMANGETLVVRARQAVVLATGSIAALPPIQGLADVQPWTTKQATSAKEVPGRLVVLGGGVAGCELAQAWASLGAAVTLLEMADHLLPAYDEVAGDLVAKSMRATGIDVRVGVEVISAMRDPNGTVRVALAGGEEVVGDELLVAAGRRPRTEDIGLQAVGIDPGSWLDVDDTMAVRAVPEGWLYAPGDVNHRVLLTHQGKYQARVCGDAIVARSRGELDIRPWSPHVATADERSAPQVVFTDPEVAAVGLTERQATAAGFRVRVVSYPLGNVAGAALHADGYEGHAQLVVDEVRHVVVGALFVGSDVGELLHAATIAVVGEVPLQRLWHAVPSYPTLSEVWLRLLETYGL